MTQYVDDLDRNYPNIKEAVGYCELVFFLSEEGPPMWQLLLQKPDLTLLKVVEIVKSCVSGCRANEKDAHARALLDTAFVQMDDPEFVIYIAGKMGAV